MAKLEKVLEYIRENRSVNEIKQKLNISDKQLKIYLKLLKETGIFTSSELNNNGRLVYKINKTNDEYFIRVKAGKNNEINALVISDLHFGSGYERIDLLDKVYEYATKNDIHIILNLGDLIHGRESKMSTGSQVEKVINEYPKDESIKNIILLGNHDYHSLYYDGYDIANTLFNERTDFINAGYGVGIINILSQQIGLYHDLSVIKNPVKTINSPILNLNGHSHYFKITSGSVLKVNVPTLSDFIFTGKETIPSFLKLKLELYNGKVEKIYIQNKVFSDSIITVGEIKYSVPVLKKKK